MKIKTRIKNWKIRKWFYKRVELNQKLRPIIIENISKQTGMTEGSRDRYRELVRIRDNNTCQLCGEKGNKRKLDTHHIKGNHELSKKCDKDFNNQITLCHKCHFQVDSWKMDGKKLSTV